MVKEGEDIVKKYNIDTKKLEEEQKKLAQQLEIKNSRNFSEIEKIGAIDTIFANKLISACIVTDMNFEILEQEYSVEKAKFPYIPGFRAYRELPTMISCFNKLEEKPDIILIPGHGIAHPKLGLASHFSLLADIPTIGVAKNLLIGEVKGEDILLEGKKVGKILQIKKGANPIYISPGNKISIETSLEVVKKLVKEKHKMPEPIRLAHKYAKEIMKELS